MQFLSLSPLLYMLSCFLSIAHSSSHHHLLARSKSLSSPLYLVPVRSKSLPCPSLPCPRSPSLSVYLYFPRLTLPLFYLFISVCLSSHLAYSEMAQTEALMSVPAHQSEAVPEKVVEAVKAVDPTKSVEESHEEAMETKQEVPTVMEPGATAATPSSPFKEETYIVGELKESEKKALLEFKLKIEEAIKATAFMKPLPPVKPSKAAKEDIPKETETAVATVEASKEEPKLEQEKKEEMKEETPVECQPEEKKEVKMEEKKEEKVEEKKEKKAEADAEPEAVEKTIETVEEVKEEVVSVVECEEDLCIWDIPLLHTKGDERTDVILLKFLRARDFKLEAAMGMLRNTMKWRKEFLGKKKEDETTPAEGEVGVEFEKMAYYHGVDKEGHPVCYNNYGQFRDDKELFQKTCGEEAKFNQFLRWRIEVLEKGIQQMLDFSPGGVNSMVQVFDFKHSPGFVKVRPVTNKAVSIFQDNYPELVVNVIYINVPWYFTALYSLYSTLFTIRQKSKFVVARPGKVTETLLKYISADKIPVQYGGLSRLDDTEFPEGMEAPAVELTVKAGEKQVIEYCIEEGGCTVVWDMSVVGWDVVYGEEFIPSAEGGYTVIIQKSRKLGSGEEVIRNSFKASEAGKVVCTIDNTASRSKKLVLHRHTVKK